MSTKYQFKDRLWDVKHSKTGQTLGKVSVNADSVLEAYRHDKSLEPSTHEDEILNNALWNFLDEHKLKPDDIDIQERVEQAEKPKRTIRKASGGSTCW